MKQILDLRQLRYFVAIAEDGQVTRAAERLHIAQPALSQAMAKLEVDLGVRLLDRHARGVSLTPAGEAFLPKAHEVLRAIDEAQDSISPWLPSDSRLVIGFFSVLGPVARPLLRRLMMKSPEIAVETRHIQLPERLRLLRERKIDVELLFPAPDEQDLEVAVVLQSPRYVVLSEHHPLGRHETLVFDQIRNETFPGRHPSVPEQWAHDAWLSDYRGARPRRTPETPTTVDEVWAMISGGKAIAVLPEFMVQNTAGDGVRAVPLTDVEPLEVCIARRHGDRRAPVSALFDSVAR